MTTATKSGNKNDIHKTIAPCALPNNNERIGKKNIASRSE